MIRLFLTALLALILASCTTSKEITRTITKHDTLRVTQRDTLRQTIYHRDSIFFRDSIYTEGATLVKERWRERWHIRYDTLRISRVDTIYQAKHSTDKTRKVITRHPWYYGLLPILGIVALIAGGVWYLAKVYRRF